ncbi:MAG TPA: tRNA dihydrouridine synthase DusB [Candidatus Nanopelagicales bacterium]
MSRVLARLPMPDVAGCRVDPPVVLAPMAGITNRAFRRLCRESGAGLYVSEMITSRALLERSGETMDLIRFDADEQPRSLQLYGVDPGIVAAAVRMVVAEDLADHVDLNFGCPVPKVTRKGGGSALPWKRDLFRAVVAGAVAAADGRVPVTVKMRKGIDDAHLTYLEAGRAAAEEGTTWVALHARTADQMYADHADWPAIARLVEELVPLGVPVLGNGDIWTADDALRMIAETGCAGVVVGRGCLGRPWLFGQLAAAFAGEPPPPEPTAGEVIAVLRRHAELLGQMRGDELLGCRDIRKHMAWYLKGFRVAQPVRAALGTVRTLAELDALTDQIDPDQPYPTEVAAGPRGRTSRQKRVALPEGWLDSCELARDADLSAAELGVSGG